MAQEILINIEVGSGKAVEGLGKTREGVNKLEAAKKKLNYELSEEARELAKVNEAIKQQQIANKNAAFSNTQYGESFSNLGKKQKQFRAQSGLNNAILLETGRLASDASFGFTAIANNLSQVVSLTQSFVRTNGSAVESFKQLRDSLLGAGGVMIGVQLLISFLPKIIAFFSDTTKEVNKFQKAIDDATKSLDTQIETFETLTSRLEKYGDIGELGADVNYLLAGSFSEFDKALNAIDEGALLKITDSFGEEKLLGGAEATEVLRKKFLELLNVRREEAEIAARLEAKDENGNLIIRKNTELRNKLIQRTITLLRTRLELEEMLDIEAPKRAKDSAEFQIKIFEAKFADFDKIEQRYRERSQAAELMTNEEVLAQTQQNEMAKIDIIEEAFVRKEQLRLKDYKSQLEQDVKAGKITRETADRLSREADEKYLSSIKDLGEKRKSLESEVLNFISSLRTRQIRRDANFAESQFDQMVKVERKLAFDRLETFKIGFGDEEAFYDARAALLQQEIIRQKKLVDATKEGTLQRANAEAALFKTQQQFRANDLAKEKAAIDEKMRINQQYISFARSISTILSELAGENEEIQKAALIFEKGAAIADVVFQANASNAMILSNMLAANSMILTRYAGVIPAAAPEMAAVTKLATGMMTMNKIGAGLSIGAILATGYNQYRLIGQNGSTGGTGSASVQAPDFNVVGASPTNQLAEAVSGQMQQPVRAFVVGAEITEQQELDRKIIETAGL